MTIPVSGDQGRRRFRSWSAWLWLLAAILGGGTLWSAARVVHDNRLRRGTIALLAQDKATEIARLASAQFDGLALSVFAPVLSVAQRPAPAAAVVALSAEHVKRVQCRCREALPISEFFRYDADTRTALTSTDSDRVAILPDSVIARISTAALAISDTALTPVTHLFAGRDLKGLAVMTVTERERSTTRATVYGAVASARDLVASLFESIPLQSPRDSSVGSIVVGPIHMEVMHSDAPSDALVRLDSISLAVSADTAVLFGALAPNRSVGSYRAPGPLSDLTVTVALSARQASMAVLMPVAHDRLELNGLLVLSTIIAIILAVASSRRELLLARARSDFIAGVSHDLRMPLAQILLASETLALDRQRDETDRTRLVASILREARRLGTLVDNVLLFSRSGAVSLTPRMELVPLRELFAEVVEAVHLAADDAGQTIVAAAHASLSVRADRSLLRQAMVNLVDNAIKYGKRGQHVRLNAEPADSGRVRITVDDEGPGIPRGDRTRLFAPYERLGRDQASERTGSGLGLTIVRQIIEACGGSVAVDDAPGGGARITVLLQAALP